MNSCPCTLCPNYVPFRRLNPLGRVLLFRRPPHKELAQAKGPDTAHFSKYLHDPWYYGTLVYEDDARLLVSTVVS